jgi:hypothetical protein
MIEKLQRHTVNINNLHDEEHVIETINAVKLIDVSRFDLFAKLIYIKYRKANKPYAEKIYRKHIKAFNPNLKEPGREDKNGYQDFLNAFEKLIQAFKSGGFDSSISLIPVDKYYTPLDGSHRIAALAFYKKTVDVVKFTNIKCKTFFNFRYFLNRGLPLSIADNIAYEALSLKKDIYLACFLIEDFGAFKVFENKFKLLYIKKMSMLKSGLLRFENDLTNNKIEVDVKVKNLVKGSVRGKHLVFVFFQKDESLLNSGFCFRGLKLYFSSNTYNNTLKVADLVLTDKSRSYRNCFLKFKDSIIHQLEIFKPYYLYRFKVLTASFLSTISNYGKK